MKSNVISFQYPTNVAPAKDGEILVECVYAAIAEFGPQEFAESLVEGKQAPLRQAA